MSKNDNGMAGEHIEAPIPRVRYMIRNALERWFSREQMEHIKQGMTPTQAVARSFTTASDLSGFDVIWLRKKRDGVQIIDDNWDISGRLFSFEHYRFVTLEIYLSNHTITISSHGTFIWMICNVGTCSGQIDRVVCVADYARGCSPAVDMSFVTGVDDSSLEPQRISVHPFCVGC